MSKLPWFAQYPSDFIAGCQGLEGVQIGVYSMLLNLLYARRANLRCRTIDDQQKLARTCGVTTRAFNRIVAELATMPNKITRDKNGDLSNPRFEKWLKSKGEGQDDEKMPKNDTTSNNNNDLFENVPPHRSATTGTAPEQKNAEKTQKNPSKIPEKPTDKIPKKQPTSNEINPLQPNVPPPPHARARPRNQKPEVSSVCSRGGAAAAPPAPPLAAHTHDAQSFETWRQACKRTAPRGTHWPIALRRWSALPPHPIPIWIDAWDRYVGHCHELSKSAKHPQRIARPENWFKTGYQDYLDEALAAADRTANAATKRASAIQRWGAHALAIIAKIGEAQFDAWLIDAEFVITSAPQAELRVPKPFAQRYLTDHREIVRAIEAVTKTSITVTGQPQPQQERA